MISGGLSFWILKQSDKINFPENFVGQYANIAGKYFEPHGAEHYIILYRDGTFVHNWVDYNTNQFALTKGKFSVSGEKIVFTYDAGYPQLNLEITRDIHNIYLEGTAKETIKGTVQETGYYFVRAD